MNGNVKMSELLSAPTNAGRWRLQRWPTDRAVDHLIFVDMFAVPSSEDFERAARRSAARGATAVRTSALFPSSQQHANDAGYRAIDHLSLLSLNLDDNTEPTPHQTGDDTTPSPVTTGRMRIWHMGSASEVDRLAFGPMWGNSANSLQAICSATNRSRARVVQPPRGGRSRVDGFAISGITDNTGYIQRLAVHPEARGLGIARTLMQDALGWMRRHGVGTVFVNTGVDNTAGLHLYASLGFEPTGEVLTIHERRHQHEAAIR